MSAFLNTRTLGPPNPYKCVGGFSCVLTTPAVMLGVHPCDSVQIDIAMRVCV